jgi:hypothetical protein
MPFALEHLDYLQREEAEGLVGATVVLPVCLRITFHAVGSNPSAIYRVLRDTAVRDVDLMDMRHVARLRQVTRILRGHSPVEESGQAAA